MQTFRKYTLSKSKFKLSGHIPSLVLFILLFLYPNNAFSSTQVLDSIDIQSIQNMQLLKKKNVYWLDIECVIRNSGKKAVAFNDCKSKLSIVLNKAKDIDVGSNFQAAVLIPTEKDAPYTDSMIRFTTKIGQDIGKLHYKISSSDEMTALLTDPKPMINLRIQSSFELGLQIKHGWVFFDGVTIDWVIPLSIPRDVFVNTFKAIEAEAEGEDKISEEEMEELLNSIEFKD